ncbi:TonB-dependent receptor plug domain-containing protein, partial [Gemmatimonadota bacterium]
MGMLARSCPNRSRPWVLSTLTLLFLTGCATTRLTEEDQPPRAEALEIGYGTINQDHLVGSVSTVYSDEGEVARTRTIAEMLARVPGVQVRESRSGGVSVLVRGASPLYVLDGMIFRGSLNSINPST